MERFTLREAAAWTQGEATGDAELTGISTDSRQIGENTLFVPICGERFDAHDFIRKAIDNGAAAVVSHRENETYRVPALHVKNTAQALLDLAGGYRDKCGGKVVGVTGSVGKTTTKELLYAVLREHFHAQKTEGNLNNEIGLPLTLFTMTRKTEVLVAEMGMNHFGEISRMTAAAKPDLAVITNIGTSHIEFLGSREGICKAKLEILEGLKPGGCAVLCGDEPLLWEKRAALPCSVVTYGIENHACSLIAHLHEDGTFDIVNNSLPCDTLPVGRKFTASLSLPGAHNVLNALAAAAVGLLMGETPEEIARGLASYEASGMRQNIYERDGFTIFADCYNASPDAMEATIKVLGTMSAGGRRFAVLGSMLELGAYAKEGHQRAGRAAAQFADALYAYGPDADEMVAGAKERGMENAFAFSDQRALADALRRDAQPGDALLFKGSRGMQMERALALFLGEDVEE
ncbi:UDP-N-acetylmuramoyl-tripeptide--D-alanyl-D-alanine ligase [Agathobaculum sp.]|uniref:UDP-N-acetylmuramoyl-tripeptide--D-alanyl-D- alanine ligase n=1 Tax=Agathobaculum sp. TaxID=2048138 RepID=UPI002A817997|nr:UDP-N-acetylmuramoyl-tripeptide--D-alanyl-D-alanine ligase [Agathobaculum sp.]MDY3617542.1 UDP-N-acetylmuramoyl-tripeptide--D-alanyl-D-alanine ligase [Agathobaculum sp.]